MSASNGQRQQPLLSKAEQIKTVTAELKNLSMATRITQMMLQKLATDVERLDKDMHRAMGILNDLQYRTLATVEVGGIDKGLLDSRADELKLVDYDTASAADDKEKSLVTADVVDADSVVIITSEAPNDAGIFRSKFKVSETGVPDLEKVLLGKTVGEKFPFNLNGVDHTMEIVGVRKVASPVTPVTPVAVKVDAITDTTTTTDNVTTPSV